MSANSLLKQLFVTQTLKFDTKTIDTELIPVPIKDANFGILNLQACSAPVSQQDQDLIFMIDCSGSMSDKCSDGRSKMQHIVHTLKNMVFYFKENQEIRNHITIKCFDDKIYNIVERTAVNSKNFNEIIFKIDEIIPQGSTNIELALQNLKETIDEIKKIDNYCGNICNIFMTDGDVTSGNNIHEVLAEMVDRSITNAFIGFGLHHDATLLNALSDGANSEYYFIDKLENSGFVYGEILHGIIYKLLKNVKINISDGFIYNFKKNIWVDSLTIDEIVSESNKMYHVCSNKPYECVVNLTADKAVGDHSLDTNMNMNMTITSEETNEEDLTKYIYRQRTLQHLFMAKEFLKRKKTNDYLRDSSLVFNLNINKNDLDSKEEQTKLENDLAGFMEEMKKFMTDHNLLDDKIMKNLCDDIYICYRTLGTKFGAMYVTARQSSQGTQRGYNVSHTPDAEDDNSGRCLSRTPLRRRDKTPTASNVINNMMLPPLLMHNISDFDDAPYLTPTATKLMRNISDGKRVPLEEDIEESQIDYAGL